nr:hypothetical protein [Tanacetum cinerariifolium]
NGTYGRPVEAMNGPTGIAASSASSVQIKLLGDLQLAGFGVHVTHFLVLERRIHLPVSEAGGVATVDGAQQVQLRVVFADLRHVEEVDLRFGGEVEHQTTGVTQVRRAQDRQDQIRAGRHAIEAQGLAEVFALLLQTHHGGRVPQPGNAQRGVDDQAAGGFHRALALELQQAVQQVGDVAQVAEKVADAGAHEAWGHVFVTVDHWQKHPLVEAVVEVINPTVPRFKRVVDVQRPSGLSIRWTGAAWETIGASAAWTAPAQRKAAISNRRLATEKLQHGVAVDAIVHVAAVTAVRVNGQAIAKGRAQETEVARAEDHVVGVVHHSDLLAARQVILQRVQADLIDQLQQAAAVSASSPHRDHLLGDVAVEIALQRALEERCQAGAFTDRRFRWSDQAAAVDQVRGERNVGRREAERCTDQHGHLFVGEVLLGLLEVIEQCIVEVDVTLLTEVTGQLLQHQLIKGRAVGDALDVGLNHLVEVGDRRVEVHWRVDQQHFLEVEAAAGLVEFADECRIKRAEAVTGEVVLGHLQFGLLSTHRLHDAIEVFGVFLGHAGELLQVFIKGAVVRRACAGNQEDQRCRVVLFGEAVTQLFHSPEIVRQCELTLRAHGEAVIVLIDVGIFRHLGTQIRWGRGDSRFERIGQRVAIAGRIDIDRHHGRTQKQAARKGGEAQKTKHD